MKVTVEQPWSEEYRSASYAAIERENKALNEIAKTFGNDALAVARKIVHEAAQGVAGAYQHQRRADAADAHLAKLRGQA